MLDDPAQLPAVGRGGLFGAQLWRTFSVLVLKEIKRAQDPVPMKHSRAKPSACLQAI